MRAIRAALLLAGVTTLASCGAPLHEFDLMRRTRAAAGESTLKVWFFDTGRGDSILIRTPAGRYVLIDGAERANGRWIERFLGELGVAKLDAVVLTHPDIDHYGGLTRIVGTVPVGVLYQSGLQSWTPPWGAFRSAVARSSCETRTVRRGDAIDLGEGVACEVLWPPRDRSNRVASMHHSNTNSVVLRIVFGDVAFLFTGDLQDDSEKTLVALGAGALRARVLKVAHHGGRSSSSEAFLRAVGPRIAVITGELGVIEPGVWGRCSPGTLRRLEASGARVIRTRHFGTVCIETDGKAITRIVTSKVPGRAAEK